MAAGRLASVLALVAVAGAPTAARAANDALCGTTVTADLTLTADVDCTGYTGVALTVGADGVVIDGAGYRLLAPDASHAIRSDGFDDVVIQHLEVAGWCQGYGIYFGAGSRLTLDDVHADGRATGVYIINADDVTLRHLRADGATTNGLVLSGVALPIQLEDVRLTNNTTGLYLGNITGPLTLDATALPDLRGNDTSVYLAANVHDITLEGLVVDGAVYGVNAGVATNSGVTLRDVDASGTTGGGTGIYLSGGQHTLERVTARGRSYGLNANGVTDLSLDDVDATGASTTALYLANTTGALSLRKLSYPHSATGLYISGYAAPPGAPLVLDGYVAAANAGVLDDTSDCQSPLIAVNVQHVIIGNASAAAPLVLDGATYGVHAYNTSNADLTLRHLDLSGTTGAGTGLYLAGSQLTVEDVDASRRTTGFDIRSASNLTVRDVRADNTVTTALSLTTITAPLVLEELRLTNGKTGLLINGFASPSGSPFDLGPWVSGVGGAIAAIGGNDTSITVSNVQHMTVHDLTLDGRSVGLDAYYTTNVGIRAVDLDVSGSHAGRGAIFAGTGHELTRVTARYRQNGIYFVGADAVSVTDLTATGNTEALRFQNYTAAHTEPAMSGLSLTDNATALYYDNVKAPWTLDGVADGLDVTGSVNGIAITRSEQLVIQNATLPVTSGNGVSVSSSSSAITLQAVDTSGHGLGTGVSLNGGAGHVLTDVTADHRAYGVRATATSGLAVTRLVARHAVSYGLILEQSKVASGHTAPTLAGLDLRDDAIGLYFGGWDVPLTLDGTTGLGLDTTGSGTGVSVALTNDLTMRHLTIDGTTYGVDVRSKSDRLTIEDVDVSGSGRGTGLRVGANASGSNRAGIDITLRDITANRRAVGVTVVGADGLDVDTLTATGNSTYGLQLSASSDLTLRDLRLNDNATGLRLDAMNGASGAPIVFDAFVAGAGAIADLSGCNAGVSMSSSSWITFRDFATDGFDYGVNVGSGTNLVFDGVDVSGTQGLGYGISITGGVHTLTDVTADRRANGVYASGTTGLTVTGLHADRSGVGLYVWAPAVPAVTLGDITATNCTTGLAINALTGPFDIGPGVVTSLAGSETGLYLPSCSGITVHDLDLAGQNRTRSISAPAASALTLERLDVSGRGQGTGIYVVGAGHTIRDVDAHHRGYGVEASSATDLTLDDVRARGARQAGVLLTNGSTPLSLSALTLEDDAIGLSASGVGGALLTLGPSHLASLAGTGVAIYDNSGSLAVDDVALGTIAAGANHYVAPRPTIGSPGPDPDCGAALDGVTPPSGSALTLDAGTKTYTLVAHMDCGLTADPALDIVADGVTLDGAGFALFAPFADPAVRVLNRADVVVRDLDVSATYGAGAGVLVEGGANVDVIDVIANDRARGVDAKDTSDLTVSGLVADRSATAGLDLTGVALPLALANLSLTRGANHGLRIADLDGDPLDVGATFVVDGAALTDVSGNDVSIYLGGTVSALTVTGAPGAPLVLDGAEDGVLSTSPTHDHVALAYLDVSGPRGGKGVELGGSAISLAHITARDRVSGFEVNPSATDLTLTDVTVTGATTRAIYLLAVTPPLALTGLTLTDSAIALDINGFTGDHGAPTVVDTASLLDVARSLVGLKLTNTSDLALTGYPPGDRLRLPNRDGAVLGTNAANHDITLTGLDASAPFADDFGIRLYGASHTLDDVVADWRTTAVYLQSGSDPTIDGLSARGATTAALRLEGLTGALTLSDLSLTDSAIGLDLAGLAPATRFVFDETVVTTLLGNGTCVRVGASSNLGFEGLTLPCLDYGLNAYDLGNSDLRYEALDASGPYHTGYGLRLYGTTTLVDVTANTRAYGVEVYSAPGLVATGVTVDGATSGSTAGIALNIVNSSPPLTLSGLALTNSSNGLRLAGVNATAGAPLVLSPANVTAISGHVTASVVLAGVSNVTLSGLTLDGQSYGVDGRTASNAGISVVGCDLSGDLGAGIGGHIYGADHALVDVDASDRNYGIYLQTADGFELTALTALRDNVGLLVNGYPPSYGAPTLADLTLRGNTTAIQLYNVTKPLVFDNDPGLASPLGLVLADNKTDISLTNGSADLTFKNLTLTGWTAGLSTDATTSGLTLEAIDASGSRLGDGVILQGPGHVVTGLTVRGRRYGLDTYGASAMAVTNLTVDNGATGLYLRNLGPSHTAPTLSGLQLTGLSYGVAVANVSLPMILDGVAQGLSIRDTASGIWVYPPASDLTLRHLDLRSTTDAGITFYSATVSHCTIDDVDVSGPFRGKGLSLAGPDHTVTNITANDRDHGVWGSGGLTGLTLATVEALRARSAGVYLANATTPTLTDLAVSGAVGLHLVSVVGPTTLGPSALSDVTGARTGVQIAVSQDLVVDGLTLPNHLYGVSAGDRDNRDLTFQDLDVTGSCRGTGINVGGERILLDHVTAGRRATAILANVGDDLVIRDSVAGASTTGVDANYASLRLDTTVAAAGTNTTTYLRLVQSTSSFDLVLGETVRVSLAGGDEDVVVTAKSGYFITVSPALSQVPPAGTPVRALDAGGDRVVIEGSDICANGTGLLSGARQTLATGDYWRAASGPTHASNPGGTGDLVNGTSAAVTPFELVPSDKLDPYCNQAPEADAGQAQTVCEGDTVTLDATGSSDPDVEPLTYLWTQLSGTSAALTDGDTASGTFTAPHPITTPEVLTFEVTVADDILERADTVEITVEAGNPVPTAVAGADQGVDEGATVGLSAAGSFDPDGTALTYAWVQTAGPAVTLTGADTDAPSFTAPALGPGGGPMSMTLTFELTVTDQALPGFCGGDRSAVDGVDVVVNNIDSDPIADAGADQAVDEATLVSLTAAGSSDPDGDGLSYVWAQLSGTTVTLTGGATATPTFTAPQQGPGASEVLVFRVTVSDGFGGVSSDDVQITVGDVCPDSDGDGVVDCDEDCDADPDKLVPGVCGCGVADSDGDGDGAPDCVDGCPTDPNKTDPGVCGCGQLDTDSNANGTPDCAEDCGGQPDGTVVASGVPCGSGACGDITADVTCEGGVAVNGCDAAYAQVPDDACTPADLTIAYAIVYDAAGAPVGTIRCTRDALGAVACDEDQPGQARVYQGLYCPGVTP